MPDRSATPYVPTVRELWNRFYCIVNTPEYTFLLDAVASVVRSASRILLGISITHTEIRVIVHGMAHDAFNFVFIYNINTQPAHLVTQKPKTLIVSRCSLHVQHPSVCEPAPCAFFYCADP